MKVCVSHDVFRIMLADVHFADILCRCSRCSTSFSWVEQRVSGCRGRCSEPFFRRDRHWFQGRDGPKPFERRCCRGWAEPIRRRKSSTTSSSVPACSRWPGPHAVWLPSGCFASGNFLIFFLASSKGALSMLKPSPRMYGDSPPYFNFGTPG